ncbi:MAG: flavodoxin [Mailhella sp.]|nr:flavodoxin [Mailhella sp.]
MKKLWTGFSDRRSFLKSAGIFCALAALHALPPDLQAAPRLSGKMMIVYFSMPETDRAGNMTKEEENSTVVVDGKVLGNTQYVALLIQNHTGADIFRLETVMPYMTKHKQLVDYAKREQRNNARPALKAMPDLDAYDIVFLGYPNWWSDMPMPLYTFLEAADLSGKTIIPFNTHGGSRFSKTISTIARLQPRAAVVRDGYTVSRSEMESCAEDVPAWLRRLGMAIR